MGDEHAISLDESFEGRAALIRMLSETHELDQTPIVDNTVNGTNATNATIPKILPPAEDIVVIPGMIPKFIKVLNSGDAAVVSVLNKKNHDYRPLVIKMHRDNETNGLWWEIRDYCEDAFYTDTLSKFAYSNCTSGIVMYTFNDKKFPSTFSFLTAGGLVFKYIFTLSLFNVKFVFLQHHWTVHHLCVIGLALHEVLYWRTKPKDHVRGSAVCGSSAATLPGYLSCTRSPGVCSGGGPVCQITLPVPITRDADQVDPSQGGVRGR